MKRALLAAVVALGLSTSMVSAGAAIADDSIQLTAVQRTATHAGDPRAGAPKVGQCYAMTRKQAFERDSAPGRPISCKRPHTMWISKVGVLPKRFSSVGTEPRAQLYINNQCNPATHRMLGSTTATFARSAYLDFVFVAGATKRAHGARWFTCTVAAAKGRNSLRTTSLQRPVQASGAQSRRYQACVNGIDLVSCDSPYDLRPVKVLTVRGGWADATARDKAAAQCSALSPQAWAWRFREYSRGTWTAVCFGW